MNFLLSVQGIWLASAAIFAIIFRVSDVVSSDTISPTFKLSKLRSIVGHVALGLIWPIVVISLVRERFSVRRAERSMVSKLVQGPRSTGTYIPRGTP